MKKVGFRIFVIVCAVLVPALFVLNAIQADRYMKVQNEIKALEQKQAALVEENKRLITDISPVAYTHIRAHETLMNVVWRGGD